MNSEQKLVYRALLFVLLALLACAGPEALRLRKEPMVRIGLMQGVDEIQFQTSKKLAIQQTRRRYVVNNVEGQHWRVRIKDVIPPQFEYRLLLKSTTNKNEAKATLNQALDLGLPTSLLEEHANGEGLNASGSKRATVYKVVLKDKFDNREKAVAKQQEVAAKLETQVWEVVKKPAQATLELKNLDKDKFYDLASGDYLVVDQVAFPKVAVGAGFHWEGSETRSYGGRLEFLVDRAGKLTVVNVLPLEQYVSGVVASEMPATFPLEALKAQAVAARNQTLSKVGARHPNESFDLCAEVHCQVYSGITKQSESTEQAVKATAGVAMTVDGEVVEANYAGVCGGQTENNENVWGGSPKPHLRSIFDGEGRSNLLGQALKDESNVRGWITTKPSVYCNTTQGEIPPALEYSKKYFRWEFSFSRQELQTRIRKKTGEDFGELRDLVALERGPSGRLIRLQVVGSKKTIEISRELAIRQALAEKTLWSACIVIEKVGGDRNRPPEKFRILGAGWGHGVGMCQAGAAMMAVKGFTFDKILQHYYTNIKLERKY